MKITVLHYVYFLDIKNVRFCKLQQITKKLYGVKIKALEI